MGTLNPKVRNETGNFGTCFTRTTLICPILLMSSLGPLFKCNLKNIDNNG